MSNFNSHFSNIDIRQIRTTDQIKMFKPSGLNRAKSPYQPKLLQALIDSSDEDKFSIPSDEPPEDNFDHKDRSDERKTQNTNLQTNEDKKSDNYLLSSSSQRTLKIKSFADPNLNKNLRHPIPSSFNRSNFSKLQALNLTRITQSKQPKTLPNLQNQFSSNFHKPKSHSPNIAIKYDTLKLSQYDSNQIKKHQQLYQQNLKQFKQKFVSPKNSQNSHQKHQIDEQIHTQNSKQSIEDYMDSLQAMKRSNLNRRHFSKKSLKNEVSNSSSRIKFLRQQREPKSNQKKDQIFLSEGNSEIERLRQQLKRCKDVIKTLGLKNSDLQKSLEMKSTRLQQLESEQSRLTEGKGVKERQEAERKVYKQVDCYMKERVKLFTENIRRIKMNPLLEQSLQEFLAEILQLNQVTVFRNTLKTEPDPEKQSLGEPLRQRSQNVTPNRLSRSIFNTRAEIDEKSDLKMLNTTGNQFRIQLQTGYSQNNIKIETSREKAFMTSKDSQTPDSQIKGYSVKLDLSSNKENVTPNKKTQPDDDLRQLQKSLQKLKVMEKQLSTPAPKKPLSTNKLQSHDQYLTQYSIVNRDNFCVFGREENSISNLSLNNLDRSKSRRKKIFPEPNHN